MPQMQKELVLYLKRSINHDPSQGTDTSLEMLQSVEQPQKKNQTSLNSTNDMQKSSPNKSHNNYQNTQYGIIVMIQPPFFIFHPLTKSSPLCHPHQLSS